MNSILNPLFLLATLFLSISSYSFTAGKTFVVVAKHSGKCLDLTAHNTNNGTYFQQWDCTGETHQTFRINDTGDGTYSVTDSAAGRCLSDENYSLDNGTRMVLWDCGGGADQKVKITESSSGSHTIRFVASNKCMDVAGGSYDNGTNIQQWDCNNSDAQEWILRETGSTPPTDGMRPCRSDEWLSTDLKACLPKSVICDQYSGLGYSVCENNEDYSQCSWHEPSQRCFGESETPPEVPGFCPENHYYSQLARACVRLNGSCINLNFGGKDLCESNETGSSCQWMGNYCTEKEVQTFASSHQPGHQATLGLLGMELTRNVLEMPSLADSDLQKDTWECGLQSSVRLLRAYGNRSNAAALPTLMRNIGPSYFAVSITKPVVEKVCGPIEWVLGSIGESVCKWVERSTTVTSEQLNLKVGRSPADYANHLRQLDGDFKAEYNASTDRIIALLKQNIPVIALHLSSTTRVPVLGTIPQLHYFVINGFDGDWFTVWDTEQNEQIDVSIADMKRALNWTDWKSRNNEVWNAITSQGVTPNAIMYINRPIKPIQF